MKHKNTNQIRVGDTLRVWWTPGQDTVTSLTPYEGRLSATLGRGTMVAGFTLNKVGMTLPEGEVWEVVDTGENRLAAAAPKLLEALEALLNETNAGCWDCLPVEKARDAIRKAKGLPE